MPSFTHIPDFRAGPTESCIPTCPSKTSASGASQTWGATTLFPAEEINPDNGVLVPHRFRLAAVQLIKTALICDPDPSVSGTHNPAVARVPPQSRLIRKVTRPNRGHAEPEVRFGKFDPSRRPPRGIDPSKRRSRQEVLEVGLSRRHVDRFLRVPVRLACFGKPQLKMPLLRILGFMRDGPRGVGQFMQQSGRDARLSDQH